jgi:transposase InsO family protein
MPPKRAASTGSVPLRTRSSSVSTNSQGQTQEQEQEERQPTNTHDLEDIVNHDLDNNIDFGEGDVPDMDKSLDELLAAAQASNVAARLVASRKLLLEKAMNILRSQGIAMTIYCDEINELQLTESELKTLMMEYTLKPHADSKPESAALPLPPSLRLMHDLKRLTGQISPTDAKTFQEYSDKHGKEKIEMSHLVDEEAIFTIDSTMAAQEEFADLPLNWKQWQTEWDHIELARVVTLLFGKESGNTHVTISDELRAYDLQMDHSKMALVNIRGEQEIVGGIMKIFARHSISEYDSADKQARFVKILHFKLPANNIFRQDMETFPKPTTVKQWIADFKKVRERGRQRIQSASRYAVQQPTVDRSYKDQAKRQPEGDSYKADTNRQESKRQKRRQLEAQKNSSTERKEVDWSIAHCDTCGMQSHVTQKCWLDNPPAHTDRNVEPVAFEVSSKGKQWALNDKGPFCPAKWYLNGKPRLPPAKPDKKGQPQQSKSWATVLTTILDEMKLKQTSHSDYLSIFISLPLQTATLGEEGEVEMEEEVRSPGVQRDEAADAGEDSLSIQALLDTGCLVGDCMSQEIVDKLNASHLVVNIKTTICSGFDNNCSSDFPSLLIKVTFVHENTFIKESFLTTVLILPKSPIELILGRKTIKSINFANKTPSHFSEETTLTSHKRPDGTFGVQQEIQGVCIHPNHDRAKALPGAKGHAQTCEEPLVLRTTAGLDADRRIQLDIEKKTVRGDDPMDQSLCSCSKPLPPASHLDGICSPNPGDTAQGNQMDTFDRRGMNVLQRDPHPQARARKWLLQEDGSYLPEVSEQSDGAYVSSMITSSNDKPCRPRGSQTWGIIASLIKQQEQLNESQPMETDGDSQDVDSHAPVTMYGDIITEDAYGKTDDHIISEDAYGTTDDITLSTEHDVFNDFIGEDIDPQVDVLDSVTIEGSPVLRVKIRILLEKYRDVFATTLSTDPADIPPFELLVDKEKWESYSNRGPPRVQSPAKQAEILKQVTELLDQGIIEPSTASYYSQVILASKPDDTWRFCIDYRSLNDCTQSASWPIPNIKEMFARLGTHHSDTFGVMDLTAGYHQAPVGLGTRVFLAFICFCGIFQFCRLPFGPKRAPSYFQQMMSSVVLIGLLYFICEMYLDDCIVHGRGDDQFLERLELVLIRFQERKIFLKPSKCKFGTPRVEYCGKVISKEGLSMSKKKIAKVLDFPKPQTAGQMKQFIGLVDYFHDYVEHHSMIMKPLHDMIKNYQKKTRGKAVIWSTEGSSAFLQIIAEIEKGHTMYFPRDDCPIFLMTDACDYGIGAYCYQLVDNNEQSVALVSKSLNDTQFKWSILQKEAYAIFYALKQLRAILRDRHFTVQCDNRGYVFLRTDSNPMVHRWLVDTQEFDYALEDILGKHNPVADGFSRLVENHMTKELIASLLPLPPIPEYLQVLIGKVHNSVSGHHGFERTFRMLTTPSSSDSTVTLVTKRSIPFLRTHIKQYIKQCSCCQKMSMIKLPIHSHPFTTSRYYPMECLNIDFVGPYPDGGYILVIIDTFTRWVELFLAAKADAENAAKCLYQHFGRFGAPTQIRSDRGSHFANGVIKDFLSLVGTQHCLTLAYSSQQNAIVERVNKEINRHIRALTFDTNSVDDYAMTLPIVQRILNSAFSDHTKVSASQLLFGNAINLDRGLFLPPLERPIQDQPLSATVSKMLHLQDEVMKTAREVLKITDDLHLASFPERKPTEHLPNAFVLVKYRKGSPPTRLHTSWKGPLQVVSNMGSEYLLLDLITNKVKPYHITDMKPFRYDALKTDPLDIARKDYLEFFIEKILEMEGDKKKVSTFSFLVKWLGYDETYNSWEPWKNVRDTDKVHDYLRANNMGKFIPKKFQTNT